jgi:aspartyl-tRNA(Asn)/glutamyl-tRNA(Gln) amidotransferase subunit C
MARRLSEADVRKIAVLARLELTTDEVEMFSRQLADILGYADELGRVDTTGIEPTSHPLPIAPKWRSDTPVPSLDRDAILSQAPAASTAAGLFKVPKVL